MPVLDPLITYKVGMCMCSQNAVTHVQLLHEMLTVSKLKVCFKNVVYLVPVFKLLIFLGVSRVSTNFASKDYVHKKVPVSYL